MKYLVETNEGTVTDVEADSVKMEGDSAVFRNLRRNAHGRIEESEVIAIFFQPKYVARTP